MIEPRVDRRPAQAEDRATRRDEGWRQTLPLLVACVVVLAFYAGAFGAGHFRLPVGDDSFFYVGAVRAAGRLGLATTHLSARPAYPLAAASVGSVVRSSPWESAVALPFAMAAGVGLSGWALAARWGVRGRAAGLFVTLAAVCVIVGRLAAGRSENFLTLWLLAGALAVAAWDGEWRGKAGAAVLIFAAGLTEWPFLAAFLAILGCAVLFAGLAPGWRRDAGKARLRRARGVWGEHPSLRSLTLGELAVVSLVASAAAALVVFVWNETGPADAIQRLPPADRYEFFLRDTLPDYAPAATSVVAAAGWWAARRRTPAGLEPSRWLLGTWAILTGLALAAGLAGARLPTYRALMFALPVVLALAAAPLLPATLAAGATSRRRRAVGMGLAVVLAAGVLVPGAFLWYRGFRPRTTTEALGQIDRAGRYAVALPPGQAVVMTYDHPDVLKALLYRRVFEAVLPASHRERLRIFPGTGEDALAGRMVLRGDRAARQAARGLLAEARPWLEAGAPILAARNLDASGFHGGVRRGAVLIGTDLAILRGPPPATDLANGPGDPLVPLPPWWELLLQSMGMLAILVLVGLGWARFAVPGATPSVWFALSPAFGMATLSVLSLLAVRAGLLPASGAGPTVVLVALLASGAALFLTGKRDS